MDVLLAAAGVLLVLALGAALAGLAARRRFGHAPGAFRCRVRIRDRGDPAWWRRAWRRPWRRRSTWGYWRHDVLLVHRGVLRPRVVVFEVRFPDCTLARAAVVERDRLGSDPLLFVLRCDDEMLVEVTAAGEDRTLLVGPFLAAAMPGLRRAPTERYPRDR